MSDINRDELRPLYDRAKAAHRLVDAGWIDGELALSWLIWPEGAPMPDDVRALVETFRRMQDEATTPPAAVA